MNPEREARKLIDQKYCHWPDAKSHRAFADPYRVLSRK
jgi:hypothetical protein